MKAIIIDDEKLIREGLVSYIDWASLGIEICAVCADSSSGVQAVIEHQPQLILADICLPDASGLDMFRLLRSYGINCQIIFISSYSEFQYAQQAVKLGAFDYLLKPIESDVLYECVKRCVQKIQQENARSFSTCDRSLLEKLLKDSLTNVPQAGSTFLRLAGQAGIPQDSEIFLLASANSKELTRQIFSSSPSPFLSCYQAELSASIGVLCLFSEQKAAKKACGLLSKICLHTPASFTEISFPDSRLSLYQALQDALTELILKNKPATLEKPLFLEECWELSPEVIQNPDPKTIESALYQFFSSYSRKAYHRGHQDFQFECFRFLETLYKQLSHSYGNPLPPNISMHDFIEQLREPDNLYDLFYTLQTAVNKIFSEIRSSCGHNLYARKALAIIRSRYSENLSLKSVAKELHVSPSYLSAVFKEDTGCPFSDYLLAYRMNLALSLVKEGNCRIYEIGGQVGYPDIAQFSKCFKKYFGYSPKQLQSGTYKKAPPT